MEADGSGRKRRHPLALMRNETKPDLIKRDDHVVGGAFRPQQPAWVVAASSVRVRLVRSLGVAALADALICDGRRDGAYGPAHDAARPFVAAVSQLGRIIRIIRIIHQ
jgi:fructose-1,6-bisphosphatase/inositol monophosphatase family enzyme